MVHSITHLGNTLEATTLENCKINYLMYMGDIKLFAKREKELETLIQTKRIYSLNIVLKFGIEKSATLIIKIGKRKKKKG